ncbi:MAG TPA: hypothetical protein VJ836_07555 [Candidatus Saccharimonadales bacterium]|nr:hypothetical protein [Candidatus Saccharimonadales bacterium]
MFFRNPINHERGLKFEEWQQTINEVLHRPGVQQQLGQLGVRLIHLNQAAFLLNVRHSEVSLPRRYLKTDRIGILPYLTSDNNLKPHDSLFQPTPARKERIQKALGRAGAVSSKCRVKEFARQAIVQVTEEEKTVLVNPKRYVHTGMVSPYDADTGILVTSRPLIVFRRQGLPRNRVLRGAVGAHELVHAIDFEELTEKPDMWYRARTVLRGHRVGAVIAEDGIASGDLTRWRFEHDDNVTIEVEAIRTEYSIDADALLNGGLQLDDDNPAPLAMGIMGIIEF